MTKKLWSKGYELSPEIEAFITGKNHMLDAALVKADCVASVAHAKTLLKCGALTNEECHALCAALAELCKAADDGTFSIAAEMEDCHTAIELALTQKLGSVGKKIHMGRSRNDQVQAALRLYMKEYLLEIATKATECLGLLMERAKETQTLPMVGRTHLQSAMPSTVGLYLASYAEQLIDDLEHLNLALRQLDRSPLGSAAGYGVPLDLDRAYTAELLGFAQVQNNVIAVQNSRARLECAALDSLGYLATTISRFAEDFILFTLPELGYFSLPAQLCSGSSIMPQKKNPDVLELLRAYAANFAGYSTTLRCLSKGLPSGYQADLQLSKEPAFEGMRTMRSMLQALQAVLRNFDVHKENLLRAFSPEVYATDEAYRLVREEGLPFREAYVQAAQSYHQAAVRFTPQEVLPLRSSQGAPGAPNLAYAAEKTAQLAAQYQAQRKAMAATLGQLAQNKTRTLL